MADPWSEYRVPDMRPRATQTRRSPAEELYDDIAEETLSRETNVRARAAAQNLAPDPDKKAEARNLSREVGLPAPVVEMDMPGYKQEQRLGQVAQAAKDPRLGNWLAKNAEISGDDIASLLTLRDMSDSYTALDKFTSTAAITKRLGIDRPVPRGPVITDQAWAEREAKFEAEKRMRRGTWGQIAGSLRAGLVSSASDIVWGTGAQVAGILGADEAEALFLDVVRATDDYAEKNRGKSTSFINDSLLGGVESIPLSIAAMFTGSRKAAAALFFGASNASSYASGREAGLSVGRASVYGATDGVIEVATEYAPMGRALDLVKGKGPVGNAIKRFLVGEALGEQAATILQDFNRFATLEPEKTFGEYMAERPEAAARTFLGTISGAGPQIAIAAGMRRAFKAQSDMEAAKDRLGALSNLMDSAAESKVRGRDVGEFNALIKQLAGDGQSIFVPASVIAEFNQDYADDAFWGDYSANISEGLETGGDVEIPLADAAARLAGTPAWDAIKGHVRADSGGMSATQIDEANAELDAIKFEAGEQLDAEARQDKAKAAPGERLREAARNKLMNTGMTPEQASTNAEIVAALYETEAANLGREVTGREFDAVGVQRELPGLLASSPADTIDLVINAMRNGGDPNIGVGQSLLEFIRDRGGINDPGGDLKSMGMPGRLIRAFDPDQGYLGGVSGAGDYGIDTTLRAAIESGFFPELAGVESEAGASQLDTQVLLDAVGRELAGDKVYAETREDQMRMAGQELRDMLSAEGIDPDTASVDEIRAAVVAMESGVTYDQLPPTVDIDGVDRPTVNSEGQPLAQTEEGVRAFWAWFGESKVVDAEGKPLVVYHGTGANIEAFSTDGGSGKTSGTGAFFTASKPVANSYAAGQSPNVMPVYLRLEIPVEVDAQGRNWNSIARNAKVRTPKAVVSDAENDALYADLTDGVASPDATKTLKAKSTTLRKIFAGEMEWDDDTASTDDVVRWARTTGYESIIVENVKDRGPSGMFATEEAKEPSAIYVAFSPTQIKSVNNRGTFDPADARILYQDGANAQIQFTEAGALIRMFETANASSFQHEMAHFWLERFKGNAMSAVDTDGNPSARGTFADWESVKAWFKSEGHPVAEDGTIPTEAHELFARSWERYLMEGKAPSVRLQSTFRKFARWLKSIYRTVKGLNAPITPEIREVMDRMLATEEQIAEAQEERNTRLMFDDAVEAGMSEADAKRYAALGEDARNEAEEELYGKVMRSIRARETKEWRSQEKTVRAETIKSVDNRPVFKALAMLREKGGVRLDRQWIIDNYGADAPALLPAGMPVFTEGGENADRVAEMAGLSSGDELVRELIGLEQTRRDMKEGGDKRSVRAATIDYETAQEMHERFGDPLSDGTIEREAQAAIQNERQGERLEMELTALGSKTKRRATPYAMARSWARDRIERSVVADSISGAAQYRYTRTAAKASRDAQKAFLRGDNDEAFRHKQTEMLHNALAREAAEASERVDVIVRRMAKYAKQKVAKNMPWDYLAKIHGILEGYEFKRVSQTGIEQRERIAAWVDEMTEQGRTVDLPKYLLEQVALKNWSRLTVEDLQTLNDTVKQIATLGRDVTKLMTSARKRELEDVATEMEAAIIKSRKGRSKNVRTRDTFLARALRGAKSFKASHRKMASLAREMDSVEDGGVVWESLIRPAMERFDFEATENKKATESLMEILGPFYGLDKFGFPKMGGKGIYFAGVDQSFNLEERMTIVGQMGNEGNYQRLIDGEIGEFGIRWTEANLQEIKDSLTKEQMDAVQAIWSLFESYRPAIAEKERLVSGIEPKWLEPVPVETRHGTYKGGYWPVKYDRDRTLAAQQGDDAKEAERQMRGSFTAATTNRSFTKTRADKVVGRPLLYNMSAVTQGLTDVVHDLAFHAYLIDANRILRHPKVSSAIINYYGPEILEQFRTGIEDIAAGDKPAQDAFEAGINHIRKGATIAGLGWNVKTALLQPFGITQSIVRVGGPWIARGLKQWLSNPVVVAREVYAKSEFMRNRSNTMQRELNEIRNRIRGGTQTGEFINASFFLLITRTQLAIDIPTWQGAYEKAIADTQNSEDRAIQLANQAVRDSQGGGQIGDLAAIQRGPPLKKMFTNFYGFFSTTYNLTAESYARTDFKKPGDVMALALDYLLLYSIPSAMGYFLNNWWNGGDDDESLLEGLISENLSFMMGTMVGLRELSAVAQSLVGAATDLDVRPYDNAYGGPAGLRALQEADRFSKQVEQGDFDRALRKSMINTGGMLFHYPSGQINRSWDGANELLDGESDNPAVLVTG